MVYGCGSGMFTTCSRSSRTSRSASAWRLRHRGRTTSSRSSAVAQSFRLTNALARKARQVEHDDELDLAFVETAVLQELLQLGAIGSLRALALFAEALQHGKALARAVFIARLQLRWQTQVLGLLSC
jgi:hypothetical protein